MLTWRPAQASALAVCVGVSVGGGADVWLALGASLSFWQLLALLPVVCLLELGQRPCFSRRGRVAAVGDAVIAGAVSLRRTISTCPP